MGRVISSFIQILGGKPESIRESGGMEQMFRDQSLAHIKVNEKIYVEKNSDQQIVAGMEIKDEEIASYLLNAISEMTDEGLLTVLTQDLEKSFGEGFIKLCINPTT